MAQNFMACDREQVLLLPPSLRDWLPADHLVWFVLDAVEEFDLRAIVAGYRADGWGRPAHDPAMMVALLFYAYAIGERSSRAIERRCSEDVAVRVITANQRPDHATIARFRVRHQDALADLFGDVLALCARAGVVSVGTIAVDGTKIHANASRMQNRGYRELAREMLDEADAVDAAEDARFGDRRGDELPPEMGSQQSRRERLRELKRELDGEREQRANQQPPTRRARVGEAHRRLCEDWRAEVQVHGEWQQWFEREKARRASEGRRMMGKPPLFRPVPPPAPAGKINVTDPDSQLVKSLHGWVQGYTAQAAATPEQIIVAADVISGGNERNRLEPMVDQALHELAAAGVDERPEVVLADAGFFNLGQIDRLRRRGLRPLVSPDASGRSQPALTRRKPAYQQMREQLLSGDGRELYRQRAQIIEPVFAHTKTVRRTDRFQRRGLRACRAEWRLIAATHNVLKLWRLTTSPPLPA
jgi:transposase